MKSDRKLTSLWQDTAEAKKTTRKHNTEMQGDVIIIGNGITAFTTALILQQEGKKCIVVSAVDIINTTPETACLNTIPEVYTMYNTDMDATKARNIAKSKREAIDLVEGLVNKYNIDCDLTYQTGYQFARTDENVLMLKKTDELFKESGVVSKITDVIPVPLPFKKAYRFDFQAKLHPVKYLQGLSTALEGEGGIVLTNCIMTAVKHDNNTVVASTTCGTVTAGILIYADDTINEIATAALPLIPNCCYNAAFTLKNGPYPDGITYDMSSPSHTFSTYNIDGQQYIVATGFEYNEDDDFKDAFASLEHLLRKYFDVDQITHRWQSQCYSGIDGLPYAGLLPDRKNEYIISCCGNNAIVYGSICAKIVCSLIYNKHSDYEELYSPERIVDEQL